MITNKTARKLLYQLHGGQWSPEYAAASSGLVDNWGDIRHNLTLDAQSQNPDLKSDAEKLLLWINEQVKKDTRALTSDGKEYYFLPWAREVPQYKTLRILSIDAWADGEGGWQWNQWYNVGEISGECLTWSNRKLLRYFRDEGYIKFDTNGKVTIEDDQYNLVVMERSNRRPLFAIEYGNLI